MAKDNNGSNTFVLNAVIGFLSLLLFLLLFGLFSRIIYPRIQNERAGEKTQLIGNVIQLQVLNGCGVPGLANRFTSSLRRNGFDVVETGNFDHFDTEKTYIISRTFDTKNARRLARAIGVDEKNIIVEASEDFYLDATLVLGSDYVTLNFN